MRRSLVFMSPLILTLACFGLTGCADSDSSAATMTETTSAVVEKAAEDAMETASTDSEAATTDVAAETDETAATSEELTAEVTATTDSESESDIALTENESDASAEANADDVANSETSEAKPAEGEQASTIGPQLPDSLKWLTDWKSRDFDWLEDWKSALDGIRRPLVLRPETPWPAEIPEGTPTEDVTSSVEAEAGEDEFASIPAASRSETKPEDSEDSAADAD